MSRKSKSHTGTVTLKPVPTHLPKPTVNPAPGPVANVVAPAVQAAVAQVARAKPKVIAVQEDADKPAQKVTANVVIKKGDFIDKAIAQTNVKRRDAKPAIEAALAVLADALLDGAELNLAPLGKLKVVKIKELNNGAKALTLKLRTMNDSARVKGGLADPSDAN